MESIGIPCEHIVAVLVYLNFADFPKSLVLNGWSQLQRSLSVETIKMVHTTGIHIWLRDTPIW